VEIIRDLCIFFGKTKRKLGAFCIRKILDIFYKIGCEPTKGVV